MKLPVILFVITSLLASITGSVANDKLIEKRSIAAGKAILQNHCARCHAISADDKSQHHEAIEFRHLSRQYPVESLAEALAEGIMSGHPDMPVFEFEVIQIVQIIDYLNSIQAR